MMMEWLVSTLVMATGLLSAGVGVAAAAVRLKDAGRAYRKTETLYATMPEGWSSWFLGGFSGMAVGLHWLWAALIVIGWTTAGAASNPWPGPWG